MIFRLGFALIILFWYFVLLLFGEAGNVLYMFLKFEQNWATGSNKINVFI